MNKQTLIVELEFSGDLTQAQHDQIVENVLDSLVHTVNTAGLVPDDAEETTDRIIVRDVISSVQRSYNFYWNRYLQNEDETS